MDTKSELKILTETLLSVLDHHAKMLEKKVNPNDLPHQIVIDRLLDAIGNLPQRYQTTSAPQLPSSIEVLEWPANNTNKAELRGANTPVMPEGPRSDTIVPSTQEDRVINTPTPPVSPPAKAIEAPIGDVTPDNIDDFANLMGEDSLQEPIIKSIRK